MHLMMYYTYGIQGRFYVQTADHKPNQRRFSLESSLISPDFALAIFTFIKTLVVFEARIPLIYHDIFSMISRLIFYQLHSLRYVFEHFTVGKALMPDPRCSSLIVS